MENLFIYPLNVRKAVKHGDEVKRSPSLDHRCKHLVMISRHQITVAGQKCLSTQILGHVLHDTSVTQCKASVCGVYHDGILRHESTENVEHGSNCRPTELPIVRPHQRPHSACQFARCLQLGKRIALSKDGAVATPEMTRHLFPSRLFRIVGLLVKSLFH